MTVSVVCSPVKVSQTEIDLHDCMNIINYQPHRHPSLHVKTKTTTKVSASVAFHAMVNAPLWGSLSVSHAWSVCPCLNTA